MYKVGGIKWAVRAKGKKAETCARLLNMLGTHGACLKDERCHCGALVRKRGRVSNAKMNCSLN